MTDEQLAYSVAKLKEMGIVTGVDAPKLGIGMMDDKRIATNYKFLVDNKLVDPAKVNPSQAYVFGYIKDAKVMP